MDVCCVEVGGVVGSAMVHPNMAARTAVSEVSPEAVTSTGSIADDPAGSSAVVLSF